MECKPVLYLNWSLGPWWYMMFTVSLERNMYYKNILYCLAKVAFRAPDYHPELHFDISSYSELYCRAGCLVNRVHTFRSCRVFLLLEEICQRLDPVIWILTFGIRHTFGSCKVFLLLEEISQQTTTIATQNASWNATLGDMMQWEACSRRGLLYPVPVGVQFIIFVHSVKQILHMCLLSPWGIFSFVSSWHA